MSVRARLERELYAQKYAEIERLAKEKAQQDGATKLRENATSPIKERNPRDSRIASVRAKCTTIGWRAVETLVNEPGRFSEEAIASGTAYLIAVEYVGASDIAHMSFRGQTDIDARS